MRCFICETNAEKVATTMDAVWVNCDSCGKYGITGTAIAVWQANMCRFDLPLTMTWLGEQRANGADRPVIDTNLGLFS